MTTPQIGPPGFPFGPSHLRSESDVHRLVRAIADKLHDVSEERLHRMREDVGRAYGLSNEDAEAIVRNAVRVANIRQDRIESAAEFAVIKYILLFLGGIAATAIGYVSAPPGGQFYVFWGAVVAGLIGLWMAWNEYNDVRTRRS
jgi:hypothetical protein